MKSVIAYLKGGLGNQMFIYAAARSLAIDTEATLKLRTDKLINDGFGREYALGDFAVSGVCIPHRVKLLRKFNTAFHIILMKTGVKRFCNSFVLANQLAHKFFELPKKWFGSLSIEGFFQAEKYFYNNRDKIVEDFRLVDNTWIEKDPVATQIKSDHNSVFLHVRSYKDIKGHSDGSASLPIAYYESAIKMLKRRIDGGNIFLFSDDLNWAMERLGEVVTDSGFRLVPVGPMRGLLPDGKYSSTHLRDFELMQLCHHGIIADSTFSWWAGWLGEQRHGEGAGLYFRPRKPGKNDMNDFWPERWIPVEY